MTELLRSVEKKFRRLKALGRFDEDDLYRCNEPSSAREATKLANEIVVSLKRLNDEWRSYQNTVDDLHDENIIRLIPIGLRIFYSEELIPHRGKLISYDVANRLKFIREKYTLLANIQPLEVTLRAELPDGEASRFELSAILESICLQLDAINKIKQEFADDVALGFQYGDRDNFAKENLIPHLNDLKRAVAEDYQTAIALGYEVDFDEMSDSDFHRYQLATEMEERHCSNYVSYPGISLEELLQVPPEEQAAEAAAFLGELVDYWDDIAEDSFSDDRVRKGRRAAHYLRQLSATPEVFELLGKGLFRPRDWIMNLKMLEPVSLDQQRLNSQARNILRQVYASFVFGQWAAVHALARASLEHTLKERLRSSGVPLVIPLDHRGRVRKKRLEDLINDLIELRPELESIRPAMDRVREQGNRAVHISEATNRHESIVEAEQRFRTAAMETICGLKQVLEELLLPA